MGYQMENELAAARMVAMEQFPYFASGICSLIPIRKEGIGTLGVDKYWRMYYDPAVFTGSNPKWDIEQLTGVIVHELQHQLQSHFERFEACEGGRTDNAMIWNLAGDCEINDGLVEMKITLPNDVCLPKNFGFKDHLLAEEYYYELLKKAEEHKCDASCAGKPHIGVSTPNGQGSQPGNGSCGSAAGNGREWEEGAPGPGTSEGISHSEGELIRRQVAHDIIEASKTRGSVPAGMERWAKLKLNPKVNWMAMVRALVRRSVTEVAGKMDFSWNRPSRRSNAYKPVIMPGMRAFIPRIGVVIDTSGSMSDNMCAQAVAETAAILKASPARDSLYVLSCDAAATKAKQVFRPDQIQLIGGGGTDMRVGINAMMEIKPALDLIIVITDCETPWPDAPPRATRVAIIRVGTGLFPAWPQGSYKAITIQAE